MVKRDGIRYGIRACIQEGTDARNSVIRFVVNFSKKDYDTCSLTGTSLLRTTDCYITDIM